LLTFLTIYRKCISFFLKEAIELEEQVKILNVLCENNIKACRKYFDKIILHHSTKNVQNLYKILKKNEDKVALKQGILKT